MNHNFRGVALVTGGTSGIGAACARALAADGWRVWTASRSNRNGAERFLSMDVSDEASVAAAAEIFRAAETQLDLIVHAAGMGISGAAEDTPDDAAHRQMEVNYFGVLRVNRHLLPHMRAGGGGKVIAIGSVAGLISIPFQSHYSSSKYALEAYIDALRLEGRPCGIQAMLIEPGDTRTGFTGARAPSSPPGSPYAEACRRAVAVMERDEQKGAPPERAAQVTARYARRKCLPARRVVGLGYKALAALKRLLPARVCEMALRMIYLKKN